MSQDDYATLVALPPALRPAFEEHVRAEAREETGYRDVVVPESALGEPGALEYVHGQRRARWSLGPGGGRRVKTEEREES